VAVFLNGDAITEPGPRGEPVRDDSFLILLSAHNEPVTFTMPGPRFGRRWAVEVDTAGGPAGPDGGDYRAGGRVRLAGHSMMVLRRTGTVSGGPPGQRRAAPE
jgi:isoamylase